MQQPTIIEIDNILVSSEILTQQFCCDLSKCHGACCIIGDSGAPLTTKECDTIKEELNRFTPYLRSEGIAAIKEQGPCIVDFEGDLVTPLIKREECAYTYFDEQNTCLCGIERAWRDGATTFKKPISCWLYPIRVSELSNGYKALNLHRWYICIDGYIKGEKEGVALHHFLREPLIHEFGEEFYNKLEEAYLMLQKERS